MNFLARFVWFTLATAIVLYLSSLFFPQNVAFGNVIFPPYQALLNSSVIVGLFAAVVGEFGKGAKYSTKTWFLVYWAVNFALIYGLSRSMASEVVAIGVSPFWVNIVLSFGVNGAQYVVATSFGTKKSVKKKRKRKS